MTKTTLPRRSFLTQAGLGGLGAAALAAPALAQERPQIRWRMQSAYPKTLDSLWGGTEFFVKTIAEATEGRIQIQPFSAGEIVPGPNATDAVIDGTVEVAFGPTYYSWGKNPAYALGTASPFTLSARAMMAYNWEAGGNERFNAFLGKQGIYALPVANTGAQMGGWFRKEIKTLDDMKGLKFRVGGFAGKILERLGVVPQQIAAGDIYPSLEKGTIDAAEWVGPYDDLKLGLVKVAPYYYYPGWWEGGSTAHVQFSLDKWNALDDADKHLIAAVARATDSKVMQFYDAHNPAALQELANQGAQLRPFSQEILDACYQTSQDIYAEMSESNEDFRNIWGGIAEFRRSSYLWAQLSEYTYDTFMMIQQRNGKL